MNRWGACLHPPGCGRTQRASSSLFSGRWPTCRLILTYGSQSGAILLFGGSALAWIASLILVSRSRRGEDWSLWMACVLGAAATFFWTVLFPSHDYAHP